MRLQASVLALFTVVATYRLPESVIPESYNIQLNFPEATFTPSSDEYGGQVIIQIRTREATSQIQIHAAHDFVHITLAQVNGTEISSITVDNNNDIATLNVGFDLTADTNYELYIEFTSRVSSQDMYGFYKSSYTSNDVTKYLITTQFQPVYARRAFPCFDEPAFKANFEINISYPSGLSALGNMPGELVEPSSDPNLITTKFATSGIMSSYLIAFILSEFTCTDEENIETNAVPYRVCSRDEIKSTRVLPAEIGPPLLRSLNSFTNLNYGSMGFPKMDQVAIPDLAAEAMENWGLVTYREQYLLWDSVESTNMDQQNIATIIAHEFAHTWWGNLVTLQWWSDTFLNEGFATYFEYFTTHDVYPEWEPDKQFLVRVMQKALEIDSMESSQALHSPADSDVQVMSKFGPVSYLKGGSIFRMVEFILGADNFQAGLRSYLSTYASKNTVPENLWASLDAQLAGDERKRLPVDVTLGQVMENWVINPGYPIIEVRLDNTDLVITQEGRFLLNSSDSDAQWYVPFSYATFFSQNFNNATEWLQPNEPLVIPFANTARGWIILNNHAGFYRVNYVNLWAKVRIALTSEDFFIPEVNRASIVDDVFHLARSDRITYNSMFSTIQFLRDDTSHYAWFPALNGFDFLLTRIGRETFMAGNVSRAITTHQLDLLASIYSTVPWSVVNDTDHAYTLKQVDILSAACKLGLDDCVSHALAMFEQFKISGVRPTKNLRSIVYCTALANSESQADWTVLWNAYHSTDVASEKFRILSALGCTQDETLLENYLELSVNQESGIRPQDAITVFSSVYSGSSVGVNIAFRFLQQNFQSIEDRYQSLNALPTMITGLAEKFTTQSQIDELKQFISSGTFKEDFQEAATAAIAAAEVNQLWLSQSFEELILYYGLEFLTSTTSTSSSTTTTTTTTTTSTPTTTSTTTTTARPITTAKPDGAAALATSLFLVIIAAVVALN